MNLDTIEFGKQTRDLGNPVTNVNEEERTFVAVIATEYKVLRNLKIKDKPDFTFWEVIDLSTPGAFNRERIDKGVVNLNLHHDPKLVVGKTLEIWQENGATYGRFKVSTTEKDTWTKIKEGMLHISLGYEIDKAKQIGKDENGIPILKISVNTSHVALVSEPADPNCQIIQESIRSLDTEAKVIEIEVETLPIVTTEIVPETIEAVVEETTETSLVISDTATIEVIASAPLVNQEMQVNAIRSIGEKYGATSEAEKYISEGKSAEEFLITLTNNKRGNTNMEQNKLDAKDIQRYSLGRAVLAAATRDVSKAVYEIGISKELGAADNELILPFESIYGRRDLTAGVAATAGNLIDTTFRSDLYSPLATDVPATINLGVKVIQGLNGYVHWPMQDTKPQASNKPENGTIGFSNSSYSLKAVTPHLIGVATRMSNRMVNMSAMAIDTMVSSDLRQALNERIDQQCMYGTGADDEVTGLFHHTGINTIALGTNGDVLDYEDIIALETAIETNNYHGSKYLFNSKVRGFLKSLKLDAGSGLRALSNDGLLNSYGHVISNVIKSDLVKGTGTGLSPILFGDWSQAALFIFGSGIKLQMNPYSDDLQSMTRLVGSVEIDFAITRQNAISAIVDAKI